MLTMKRVGIIHAYPSAYILDSLALLNVNVVLFGPQVSDFTHECLEDSIECSLHDWQMLDEIIMAYHAKRSLDALLPIYEGAVEITAIMAKKIGVFGSDIHCAQASRNKFLSWQHWQDSNLSTPKTLDITNTHDALDRVKRELGYPAILKLADSMNSQGVILVKNDDEFNSAFTQLNNLVNSPADRSYSIDRNRNAYGRSTIKIMAQSFCEGAEVSVDVLCNGDYQVVGLFEKAHSPGPYFAETMSIHPTSLGSKRDHELGTLAINAVKSLGFQQGIAHVEIRDSAEGPKLLEAGLRPGGAYTVMAIEHLLGINLYAMLLKIHLGIPLDTIRPSQQAALYGGIVYSRSGTLKSVHGVDVFDDMEGLLDVKILNEIGDLVFGLPHSAQPHFCYYLLTGASRHDVMSRHEYIKKTIHLDITTLETENG
ncbi:MAG: ATP-grasp domain-containing protein [Legionellaceae bacterium]|nr:ATP-grasp domain-containing protein [Legionellaceae bacterium]